MNITDGARDFLQEMLKEHDAENIRFYFAGFGWGQPQVGLALDEPEENDEVATINTIKVAIDPRIESAAQNLTLDFNQESNGLELTGNESDCC